MDAKIKEIEELLANTELEMNYWNDHTTNDNCIFLNIVDKDILKNTISSLFIDEKYNNMKKNAVIASQYFLYSNIAKKAIGL